ncbi:unnamed protein product [Arabis nemorensis]|uniref:DUF4283 domain-containing protein n=1 Tax=Arabis nemorensis TaxID=586526 RepID=A0A565CTX1_9BRAS|nr:unnamed protein product [Arabis nemorensis]
MDLPSQYREDAQVERIGKDLGDLLTWRIVVPYPMVRVEVGCDVPLILYREARSDTGEVFRINFDYLKLQNHYKTSLRMSHDARACPNWWGRQQSIVEPAARHMEQQDGQRQRSLKVEPVRPNGTRENQPKRRGGKPGDRDSPKLLRRDLMNELGEAHDGE